LAVIFVGSCSKDAVMEDLQLQLDPSFKITNNKVLKYAHAKFGNTKGNTIDIKPICKNSDTLAYGAGHAWLIDGYYILTIEYRYVYEYIKHDSPFTDYGDIKYEYEYETKDYVLMNWGWNNDIDNSAYSLTDYNGWYKDGCIFKNGKKIIQLYE